MTNGNEPAFSKAAAFSPNGAMAKSQEGLTKREYFAAMRRPQEGESAISLLIARILMDSDPPKPLSIDTVKWWAEAEEKLSVIHADALIKALNEKP